MSGYTFEKHTHYTTIRFTSELSEMKWEDVDKSTSKVTELVMESGMHSVLVDLSDLQTLPSGVVASLVKTWKGMNERQRRFYVVAPHQHVIDEIEQSGLAKLWNISRDLQSAYNGIGVTGQTDIDIDRIAAADEPAAAPISNEPFDLTEQHAYVAVALNPKLKEMDWQAVEQATSELISRIEASPKAGVMVDLSRMDYINSGLVASLVRIWKAAQQKKGQFSLVSPNEFVTEVLQSSGLWNLWTVVDSREEAVYELGASTAAKTEMRERRVLVMVSLPCAILASLATLLMLFNRDEIMGVNAQLMSLLLGAAALATGAISMLKDTGIRRQLSAVSVVLALLVLSTLWFKENPIAFGQVAPERNFDRDDDNEDSSSKPVPEDATGETPDEAGQDEDTATGETTDGTDPADDASSAADTDSSTTPARSEGPSPQASPNTSSGQ